MRLQTFLSQGKLLFDKHKNDFLFSAPQQKQPQRRRLLDPNCSQLAKFLMCLCIVFKEQVFVGSIFLYKLPGVGVFQQSQIGSKPQ
jgi:hypothetical protein